VKHYFIPTLISLAFTSPWAFAEETASSQPSSAQEQQEAAPKPPQAAMPPSYMDLMQKHREHRQEMQDYMQKRKEAKTPEERQKLEQEYEQLMQKHWEEMQEMDDYAPWGGPDLPPPMPPPYGGYGPRFGYPGYGAGPGYGTGYPGYGPRGRGFSGPPAQPPFVTIEQHLQNIEKLLKEIKEALPAEKTK